MFWTYDRHVRIRSLVARSRALESYLLREMADLPARSLARGRLAARLAVVRRRLARLSAVGRRERRGPLAV